jgi:hypothetical protein
MREEKNMASPKLRALNWLYITLYEDEVLPRESFSKFRKENMYFLDGMTIKLQRQEYDNHYFYVVCKKVKLPITRKEINEFLFNRGL